MYKKVICHRFSIKRILNLNGLIIFLILVSMTSCKVYFTQKTKNQLIDQNIDICDIQFYNSKKIILQRVDTTVTTTDVDSKITTKEDIILNKVIIKKNRPAVCDSIVENELYMRFEPGDFNYIVFVLENEENPESKFVIGAKSWSNDLGLSPYGGEDYYIQTKSIYSSLKIKKSYIKNFLVKKRKLKGLKIDQNG